MRGVKMVLIAALLLVVAGMAAAQSLANGAQGGSGWVVIPLQRANPELVALLLGGVAVYDFGPGGGVGGGWGQGYGYAGAYSGGWGGITQPYSGGYLPFPGPGQSSSGRGRWYGPYHY